MAVDFWPSCDGGSVQRQRGYAKKGQIRATRHHEKRFLVNKEDSAERERGGGGEKEGERDGVRESERKLSGLRFRG